MTSTGTSRITSFGTSLISTFTISTGISRITSTGTLSEPGALAVNLTAFWQPSHPFYSLSRLSPPRCMVGMCLCRINLVILLLVRAGAEMHLNWDFLDHFLDHLAN